MDEEDNSAILLTGHDQVNQKRQRQRTGLAHQNHAWGDGLNHMHTTGGNHQDYGSTQHPNLEAAISKFPSH